MKEAELNTIIKNTIVNSGGFAHKITDAQGAFGAKRPFDGFGLLNGTSVCWEAKLSKGIKAFNLKQLFEGERGHQMETFAAIAAIAPNPDVLQLWVPYGCYVPRDARVYLFSFELLRELYKEKGIDSIHAKHLEGLPFLRIKTVDKRKILIGDLESILATQDILNIFEEEK